MRPVCVGSTHHAPSKRKQHSRRIQSQHNDSSYRLHEARHEAQDGHHQHIDAHKDVVVGAAGGAAVDLAGDQVAA